MVLSRKSNPYKQCPSIHFISIIYRGPRGRNSLTPQPSSPKTKPAKQMHYDRPKKIHKEE